MIRIAELNTAPPEEFGDWIELRAYRCCRTCLSKANLSRFRSSFLDRKTGYGSAHVKGFQALQTESGCVEKNALETVVAALVHFDGERYFIRRRTSSTLLSPAIVASPFNASPCAVETGLWS